MTTPQLFPKSNLNFGDAVVTNESESIGIQFQRIAGALPPALTIPLFLANAASDEVFQLDVYFGFACTIVDLIFSPPRTTVTQQFDGNNALPANTLVDHFYVVTTTGANATIGQLLHDDGTGVGFVTVLPAIPRTIFPLSAFTGGTIEFLTQLPYFWNGTSWVLQGFIVSQIFLNGNQIINLTGLTLSSQATLSLFLKNVGAVPALFNGSIPVTIP